MQSKEVIVNLNSQQLEIVNTSGGNIAVLAGAGSGKSTTTVELIVKLFKDGVPLERMWITTFTNKAAKDLKHKLSKKLHLSSEEVAKLWIGTFHSLGFRYLTQVKKIPLNIILPVEGDHFLKNIYKGVLKEADVEEALAPFDSIYQAIELKRNQNIEDWSKVSPFPEICEQVYELYQKEKKTQNLVDFTDILYMFLEQLQDDFAFRNKFEWVFVDEAQDNNWHQHRIAELLTKKNCVLVGDVKQSIYGFRGAMPSLFKEKMKKAAKVYPLAYNYRSSKEIISFANALLKVAPQFHGQELIPTKISGPKPTFTMCDDLGLQVYLAIKQDIRNGVPLEEIAVLGRSIKPMSIQTLQVLLRRDKIPYVLRGGDDKLNASYIQNYLSLLKSLRAPTKISLTNALSMFPGVGPKTAMTLAETATTSGLDSLKTHSGKVAHTDAYREFLDLMSVQDSKDLLNKSLDFLYKHHLVPKYGKKDTTEPGKKKTLVHDLLHDYLLGFATIPDGIDSLYVNEEDDASEKGKMVISTCHQSKGLEFDSVHVVNMNEFSMPYIKADEEDDPARFEEEFCLTYVACTRAKKSLKMWMQYQTGTAEWATRNKISRFIKDVYARSGEQYFTLRALDISDEASFKEILYKKLSAEILK